MSKRSPAVASAAASAKTSPRRNRQLSATPLRRAASAASARAGSERSMPRTAVARWHAAGTANPAALAIKIEAPRIRREAGDKGAIVALVEKPAGLLPGQHIGQEHRAV